MSTLKVEVEPGEVGFDAERLERIDGHFAAYVEDGRLPGWLALLARRGQIAHLSTYGRRDIESSLMLFEAGALELKDPVAKFIPSFADVRVYKAGSALFAETTFEGIGFGLGFAVVMDPVANKVPSSVGEFSWGRAASTAFWVDPVEEITCVFLTQLLPSSTYPIRTELRRFVYQALVD